MDWKPLLASITGSVDEELRLRNAYLAAENRILRNQLKRRRVQLTDAERKTLAKMGQKLGRQALAEVATIAKPDTILAWHRTCAAQTCDRSPPCKALGRPRIDQELEALVVRMARENRSWGYDRIVGALANLGYRISDQTVGNILKRHGIPPAPARKTTVTWREFIRMHMDLLGATDFFTSEVWTWCGLMITALLCFIHVGRCTIHGAGLTTWLHARWLLQIMCDATTAAWGFLSSGPYLIHDRDRQVCPAFQQTIDAAGVKQVPLPAQSPNLNTYAERWVRSVKDEALPRLILCGEPSLRHALIAYVAHDHEEHPYQERGHVLLFSAVSQDQARIGPMQSRERLGGLLKYAECEAA